MIWAEVKPTLEWNATSTGLSNGTSYTVPAAACAPALASGMAPTFDWSKDYSRAWGSEFARNWSWSLATYKAASAIKPKLAPDATRAAAVVLDRAGRLQAAAKTSSAANFQAMAFPHVAGGGAGSKFKGPNGGSGYKGRGGNCGCETSCGFGDLNTYNYVYFYDGGVVGGCPLR